ncbi:MAG TPA: DNA starvation/stationary phase protection protein Dps [Candidatus Thermoplasmatota archaeon]|nr:DNA starvation/stationary phase protection protein Dps [Candidatus Thermoplasmatota archaeon]
MRSPGKLFPTRIQIDEEDRANLVALLNSRLADATDLYSQTKHAHWNVKGPDFQQLHELFDNLAEIINDHADQLAERATALGGFAEGTLRRAASATSLPELGDEVIGFRLVQELADRYGAYANQLRKDIAACEEHGDLVSQDLLTELASETDKALYFLEAHIVAVEKARDAPLADVGDHTMATAGNSDSNANRGLRSLVRPKKRNDKTYAK